MNYKSFTMYAKMKVDSDVDISFTDVTLKANDIIHTVKQYLQNRNCCKYYRVTLTSDPTIIKVYYTPVRVNFKEIFNSIAHIFNDFGCEIYTSFKEASGEDFKEETSTDDLRDGD